MAFCFIKDKNYIIVIDIGGNKGLYTEAILKLNRNSKVFIFEPSKFNLDYLNEKFHLNNTVNILPFGVGDSYFSAQLFSDEPGSGLASLNKRDLDSFGIKLEFSEEVNIVRFDKF